MNSAVQRKRDLRGANHFLEQRLLILRTPLDADSHEYTFALGTHDDRFFPVLADANLDRVARSKRASPPSLNCDAIDRLVKQ